MDVQPKIVFVLGAPGAGKGTQCSKLVEAYGWSHLSAGDLLRREVAAESELGLQCKDLMEQGQMVPTSFILDLLIQAIQEGGGSHFLIDGFPRKLDQLYEFEEKIKPCDGVLVFTVPEDVAVERLVLRGESSGRADDNEETIRQRMAVFKEESQPVIDALNERGTSLLAEIDAQGDAEAVFEEVQKFMDAIMQQQEEAETEGLEEQPEGEESQAQLEEGQPEAEAEPEAEEAQPEEAEAGAEEEAQEAAVEEAEAADDTPLVVPAVDGELPSDSTIVFVLGGPGSGKGTQCDRIKAHYSGVVHLSAGDLLRDEVKSGSVVGEKCAALMKEGKLVPQHVTITLLKNAMIQSGGSLFLIDGFPRALDQAEEFESSIMPCKSVLFFDCPEEEMEKRLLKRGETSGRADDNADTIRKRFHTFLNQSLPVKDHFLAQDKCFVISAVPPPEEVFEEVRAAMDTVVPAAALAAPAEEEQAPADAVEEAGEAEAEASEAPVTLQLPDCKIVFVLGAPGAGKGTQCARIVERYGWQHLSTGDLLRQEVAKGSALGLQASGVMEAGGMVPTSLILDLLVAAMASSSSARFLVDGFPRKADQLAAFESRLKPCDGVLVFTVPEDVAVERLVLRGESSGRADDNEETIRQRMAVFREESQPVIDALNERGTCLVAEIDAQGDAEAVFEEVQKFMDVLEGGGAAVEAAAEPEPEVAVAAQEEAVDEAAADEDEAARRAEEEAGLVQLAGDVKALLVICGPSGVGKGTLIGRLMQEFPDRFGFSVSHTTRGPRPGEQDGVHYHFTDAERMQRGIDAGHFLEFAHVHGNIYGTSLQAVADVGRSGRLAVLDIDVQGAEKVLSSVVADRAKLLFLAPPSMEELEARLRGRGTEAEDKVQLRLAAAAAEVRRSEEPGFFHAVIVNDDLERAYLALQERIEALVPGTLPARPAAATPRSAAATPVGSKPSTPAPDAVPGRLQTPPPMSPKPAPPMGSKPSTPVRNLGSGASKPSTPLRTGSASRPGSRPTPTEPEAAAPAAAPAPAPAPMQAQSAPPGGGRSLPVKALPVRQYMDQTVVPILREALRSLNDVRPSDPLEFLADYLLAARAKRLNAASTSAVQANGANI